MDILNNIWMAISTPNEKLVSILLIPLILFIEMPLSLKLFVSILNIKPSRKQRICYIVFTSITSIITSNFIDAPFNIIFNYLFYLIIIHYVFKLNILNTIIATILPAIVFSLIGILILNPYLTIFNITYIDSEIIPIYRLIYLFVMYFIIYVLILIIKHKKLRLNILDNIDKKNKKILFMNMVLGLIVICVQSFLTVYYTNNLPLIITFFSFLSLLLYFSISLYSLTRVMKLFATTQKLESAEEYNKTLHILHDSVRGFKHDFDNIVTTIGGYIKTNDMNGLENYYSQLEEDCQKVNNLYILNPDIINNPGIYNLLTTKYGEAEEKGIKVNLTVLLDLNNLHMKIYEFARILGILLDNAIEAASECEE